MNPAEWTSPELSGSGDATASWAADTLAASGLTCDALYVATSDAGAREALAFWSSAQQTGLALANPGPFPWTLSNSVTGRISQRLGVTGPCTTYVGDAEAEAEAAYQAAADLTDGVVTRALVVRIDGLTPIRLDGGPVQVRMTARVMAAEDAGDRSRPGLDSHGA